MTYNERLREARKSLGMTQAELASSIGVAKTTLCGYELGTREPTIAVLKEMMRILKVDANYVFQDSVSQSMYLTRYEQNLLDAERGLTDENRERLLRYALGLSYTQGDEEVLAAADKKKEETA